MDATKCLRFTTQYFHCFAHKSWHIACSLSKCSALQRFHTVLTTVTSPLVAQIRRTRPTRTRCGPTAAGASSTGTPTGASSHRTVVEATGPSSEGAQRSLTWALHLENALAFSVHAARSPFSSCVSVQNGSGGAGDGPADDRRAVDRQVHARRVHRVPALQPEHQHLLRHDERVRVHRGRRWAISSSAFFVNGF